MRLEQESTAFFVPGAVLQNVLRDFELKERVAAEIIFSFCFSARELLRPSAPERVP